MTSHSIAVRIDSDVYHVTDIFCPLWLIFARSWVLRPKPGQKHIVSDFWNMQKTWHVKLNNNLSSKATVMLSSLLFWSKHLLITVWDSVDVCSCPCRHAFLVLDTYIRKEVHTLMCGSFVFVISKCVAKGSSLTLGVPNSKQVVCCKLCWMKCDVFSKHFVAGAVLYACWRCRS